MSEIYLAKSDLTGAVYAVNGKSKTDVTEFVTQLIKVETEALESSNALLARKVEILEQTLRTIHNKHGVLNCVSYTRKQIVADYQRHREWVQSLVCAVLKEDGPAIFPELPRGGYGAIQQAIAEAARIDEKGE